mgnify:CR=1 FL=1
MGLPFAPMISRVTSLPSMLRHLITWFAGCAIVMVFAYTQLLDYYVALGIEIRTQSFLEQTAIQYAREGKGNSPLPTDRSLRGYDELSNIPDEILSKFTPHNFSHGKVQRFVNLDFVDSEEYLDGKRFRVKTFDLCGEQDCDLLFLYPYKRNDAEWLYLLHGVSGSDEDYKQLELTENFAFAIGTFFAILLILVSFFLVRNLVVPLHKLEIWSEQQSEENQIDVPDLRFSEYNKLAYRLRDSFQRVRDVTLREKLFLRHASHELRTPIAILSSNLELMDRLTERPDRSEEENAALLRQYRAIEDVQLLIETLLWINRQSDQVPISEVVDLEREIAEIVESYRYLNDEDDVELLITSVDSELSAPATAVRVVLSNLVKNAFQYTNVGEVSIAIEASRVVIENVNRMEIDSVDSDEYGFGLGLELVELICSRLEWHYSHEDITGGRRTTLEFLR